MRAGARRGPRQAAALSRAAETGHLPSACRAAGAPRIRYRGHHQDLARSSWLTTTGQRLMPDRRRPLTLEDQPAGQLPLELSQAVAEEAAGSPPDRILTDLNDEQRRAVTHESGPLLIVAGAGTGKTAVITRRIAWLIATRHARPAEILALTFTDKAAAEMEERVDVLVPYGYTDVWLSTFHAFGDRVLRDHALELGLTPDFRILTRAEQVIFFREHLFEFPLDAYRPLGDPTRYIEALIALISRAKDEDCSPAEYRAYANRVISEAEAHPEDRELADFARQQQELALTYQRYQELLASEGLVDFGDLITLTLRLLRDRPAVLRAYRERFKYILVDEFQDTNYAQFQLVRQLVGDAGPQNITVVGDDDQSIYKFRGAAISNILTFLDVYPHAAQLVLTRNYRSPQAILDTGYRLIQHNNPDRLEVRHSLDKHLKAAQHEGRPPQHVHLDTLSSEADWVAQQIAQRVEGGELRYKDCAILVRRNADADPFLRALNMRGVRLESRASIAKPVDGLVEMRKLMSDYATGRVLYEYLVTRTGYVRRLATSGVPEDEVRVANLAKFFDLVARYGEIATYDRVPEFVKHMDDLIAAGDDPPVAQADLDQDAVNVLTVHRAKGLEFPVVFLVSCVADRFPTRNRGEPIPLPDPLVKDILPSGDFHLQEERRLFYVAMTRAQRELYLTSARDYGGVRSRKVSRFVLEALDLPAADTVALPASPVEAIHRHAPKGNGQQGLEGLIPADQPIFLSYRQVDDYDLCPLKYKYTHILRVPLLRDHRVVYGSAIHEAIREYHRRRARRQLITFEDLVAYFERAWVNEGFVSRDHEDQRLAEGREVLSHFYRYQEASGQVPTFVEAPFSFQVGLTRIKGRWDRVDLRGDEAVLIDFKTSDVRTQKDADRRARESLQLALYALAYREVYGTPPARLELHFLGPQQVLVGTTTPDDEMLKKTATIIERVASGIRAGQFIATPDYYRACRYCAFASICPYTATGDPEWLEE